MRRAVAVVLAAVAWAGCGKSRSGDEATPAVEPAPADAEPEPVDMRPEKVVITGVEIATPDTEEPQEMYTRVLGQEIGKQLTGTEWFVRDGDPVPDTHRGRKARCLLAVGFGVVESREMHVTVEMKLEWEDGGSDPAPNDNVAVTSRLAKKDRNNVEGALVQLVVTAVGAATASLIEKEELRSGGDEKIFATLDEVDLADPAQDATTLDLASWALVVVRERRIAQAYDRVVRLLGSSNVDLRQAAVGALIAIGDRRAVPHIAKTVKRDDPVSQRIAIDAIASLGGDEAMDYLDYVATGSTDREIAAQAKKALERLRARAGK